MALIPAMKSSGASSPRSISPSRYSHSAVRRGDCSCSGNTVIRDTASWDGMSCTVFLLFFRSKKPVETSFSRIPARVAGVPRPLRSASSGISSFPAVSIAESSVSSVKCLGGVVLPSLTVAPERQRLTFRQLRQSLVLGFFVLLHILQPCAIGGVQRPPAVIFHCAAFGSKLRSGALDNNGGFRKGIGLGHGAQQAQSHQLQHRLSPTGRPDRSAPWRLRVGITA